MTTTFYDQERLGERIDQLTESALNVSEQLATRMLEHGMDPICIALAASLLDVLQVLRRAKRKLELVH